MRLPVFWVFGVIFGLVPIHARPVQQKTGATPIVITHVTVINPGTSSVLPNRTVVIIGNRFASLSDAATFQTPKNAHVIDATGKFLIPGLCLPGRVLRHGATPRPFADCEQSSLAAVGADREAGLASSGR
jgi:alpha-D-ribose 1-methylphosphonate 5-triphosphate diphosphatase PhnM